MNKRITMKKKIEDEIFMVDSKTACMDANALNRLFQELHRANKMLRLQKKKLLEEKNALKKQGDDLILLNELSKALVSTLDTEKIIHTAFKKMQAIVPHHIMSLFLFKRKKLWVLSTMDLLPNNIEEIKSFMINALKDITGCSEEKTNGMSVIASAIEAREMLIKKNGSSNKRLSSIQRLFFPMEVGDARVGGIVLVRYSGTPFSEHEHNITSMVVSTLTLALRNSEIHEEVQKLATTDSLTCLYNKRYFLENLSKMFKTTLRYQTPVSLIMIDIDNFKLINDHFGHQAGDQVLKEISTLLTKSLREIDIPARYGGDEIAIILPETEIEQAFFVARRIKRLIESSPVRFKDNVITLKACFGISSCPNPSIKTVEDMIAAADTALYKAKRNGKNRIEASEKMFMQDNAYLGPLVF